MNTKQLIRKTGNLFLIVLISVGVTTFTYSQINKTQTLSEEKTSYAKPVGFGKTGETLNSTNIDFTNAAEKSVNAVVHIKTKFTAKTAIQSQDPFFNFFFGRPEYFNQAPQQSMGSGSGVIISSDGYIVTNNHVIDRSDEIEITLNDKRSFNAKLIGVDPSTDIALLKIEVKDLSPIIFGNSDNMKIGEWVLAVGNPFNLTSTVTVGIVSAKARNINILNADMKIESFIQTDAAVNPGNSGGALVNTRGELIGINTAIASQTGNYAGYSFAIPSSIVSKVVADLKEFGTVQRALLGVNINDITDGFAKEKKISTLNGVFIASVAPKSAAEEAGLKEGDIITTVNNMKVKSVAELQEQISRYRPGDKISIIAIRGEKEKNFSVELKNQQGNTGIVKKVNLDVLGGKYQEISNITKQQLGLSYGIQVTSVSAKGKLAENGIKKDFIIVKINNQAIKSINDIEVAFSEVQNSADSEKGFFITGIYPNGKVAYYALNLNEK